MKTWPWVLSLWVCSMHLWCVVEILHFIDKRVTQHCCTLGSSISWQKSTSVAWIIWAWKCHCTLFALLDQTASLLGVPFNCQKRAEYNIFIYITLFSEIFYPKRSLSSLKRVILCVVAAEIPICKWVTAVRITGFGLPEAHKRWTLILRNWICGLAINVSPGERQPSKNLPFGLTKVKRHQCVCNTYRLTSDN